MLRGYLDALTARDQIVGWALDTERPLEALLVAVVLDDGREVASGYANGYRRDLAQAGCGTGWCALQLKLHESSDELLGRPLSLIDRLSRGLIMRRSDLPCVTVREVLIDSVEKLSLSDPHCIESLDQLSACEPLLQAYVTAHGAEAFVRAAYRYLLHRPADAGGLKGYADLLKKRRTTAYGLLRILAESDEYRSRERRHASPVSPGFPFRSAPPC